MSGRPDISVILCTRNRSDALARTLASFANVRIPAGRKAELLVVDNASTDATGPTVRNAQMPQVELRHLVEPRPGKGYALNLGLSQARGELILFSDDDVDFADDWMERMAAALVGGAFDAVTGGITIAPGLQRAWQTPDHRWWLASSHDARPHEGQRELIGANMGIRRVVLERVPGFDPELGPGALGFGEDSLFGWQLVAAGFKVGYVPAAAVIHHFDASRLLRREWIAAARKHGRTSAYQTHHWLHDEPPSPVWLWLKHALKLRIKRLLQPPGALDSEGCQIWELECYRQMEFSRQFRIERRRPRNYDRRGLVKKG